VKVATNRPSRLRRLNQGRTHLPILATFPQECRLDTDPWRRPPERLAFAAGGAWGDGRVLVLADHSVFINEMVCQRDNDNLDFASACLDWLTEREGGGRRHRVLFIEDQAVQTKFDMPMRDVPIPFPPLEVIVGAANRGLRGLEEEDVFNRMLDSQVQRFTPLQLLQGFAVVLTTALALYCLLRFGAARQHVEPGTPLLETVLSQSAPAGSVSEQRRQELRQQDNFWEPARSLARQWFETAAGAVASGADRPGPAFTVGGRGGWWRRRVLARRVRRLWRLAQGGPPRRFSQRRLLRLQADLRELDAALDDGTLRFGERKA
jgi:hypothetical protein